jgi:hypothetical protein
MARLGKELHLTPLDVKFAGAPRPVSVMTVKNRSLSPLAELFIDFVRESARPLAKN